MGQQNQRDVAMIQRGRIREKSVGPSGLLLAHLQLAQKIHQHLIMTCQVEFTAEQSGVCPPACQQPLPTSAQCLFLGPLSKYQSFLAVPMSEATRQDVSRSIAIQDTLICWLFVMKGTLFSPTQPNPSIVPNFTLLGPTERDTGLYFWNDFSLISHSERPLPCSGQ